MATEQAKIQASLDGVDDVVGGAGRVENAWSKVGSTLTRTTGGALSNISKTLKEMAKDGLYASGVLSRIDVGGGAVAGQQLDKSIARIGQTATMSRDEIRVMLDEVEKRSGVAKSALAGVSANLSEMTGDTDFAVNSLASLTDVAAALGRDVGQEISLFTALRNGLSVTQDTTSAVERLAETSRRLDTVGGPRAFLDTISELGPALEQVRVKTDKDRDRLVAFIGAVSKGARTPREASARVQEVLGTLQGRALDIQRVTGVRTTDAQGKVVDPLRSLELLQKQAQRRYGKSATARERASISDFGVATGTAIGRADVGGALSAVQQSQGREGLIRRKASAFQQSDVGQRDKRDTTAADVDRKVGNVFNKLGDNINKALGPRSAAVVGKLAGTFGGDIAAAAGGSGKNPSGGKEAGGMTGAIIGALGAVALAGTADTLDDEAVYNVSRQRAEEKKARAAAAGLSPAAYGRVSGAEPTPAGQRLQVNNKEVVDALNRLPTEIADAMRKAPIYARQQPEPNESRGN